MRNQLFLLDSRDQATRPLLNYQFSLPLSRYVNLSQHIRRFSVKQISFVTGVPSINDRHRYLYVQVDSGAGYGATTTVTLTPGVYTVASFVPHLKARLEAALGGTWTVSMNSTTYKLSIGNDLITSFRFMSGADDVYQIIGYDPLDLPDTVASTRVAPGILDLSGSKYIDVVISGYKNTTSTSSVPATIRVPVTENFGTLVVYQPSLEISVDVMGIDLLEVRLYDDSQRFYELPVNCPVEMTLELQYGFGEEQIKRPRIS